MVAESKSWSLLEKLVLEEKEEEMGKKEREDEVLEKKTSAWTGRGEGSGFSCGKKT